MASFSTEKLQFYINAYQKELSTFWEDEKYKWEAVQCFQDNWNIESEDFGQMLKTATRKHLNLLGSGNYFPLGMLQEFIGVDKERVRNMFRLLYDESRDVVERISAYQAEAEQIRLTAPEKWRNHYQDLRAISVLLWLRYPNKYYIYKYREFNRTLKLIDSDFSTKGSSNPAFYKSFLELMDYLCSIISKNKDLEQTLRSLVDGNPDLYSDDNFHITTVDFVFYVGKRYQQINTKIYQEPANNTNMTIKEQFRIYLANCVKTNRSTDKSFIIGKTTVDSYVSFAEVDKLFDYDPEQWGSISSIYDITSSQSILDIIEKLLNDDAFKTRDSNESSQYFRSNAIKQYYCFLKARELFGECDQSNIISTNFELYSLQQIFYGAPGTGKSHEVKKQSGELSDSGEERDLPNVFRTTFHPDTDYASFVGCYKPTMKPTSKEEKTLTGKDEEIVYEFVPQAFTDAYVYAYNNPEEPTYLVIEEINRGNCAQIFGDLFQLLDRKGGVSEYKIKADKDLANYLIGILGEGSEGIKDGKLCLPANLSILATMNTSDQSLFPMDSAFKRRWEWEYVPINYGTDVKSGTFEIKIGEKAYPWVDFIKEANKRIFDLTQSEDKQLGNFFIKHSVDEKEFKSKVMFYLWYEVLRDETENNKYFFYKQTTIDGKDERSKFIFKDLYEEDATQTLQQFMDYLGVPSK